MGFLFITPLNHGFSSNYTALRSIEYREITSVSIKLIIKTHKVFFLPVGIIFNFILTINEPCASPLNPPLAHTVLFEIIRER